MRDNPGKRTYGKKEENVALFTDRNITRVIADNVGSLKIAASLLRLQM